MPPVRFQLGLAGATGADAAAQPGEVLTAARQPWQTLLEGGEMVLLPAGIQAAVPQIPASSAQAELLL